MIEKTVSKILRRRTLLAGLVLCSLMILSAAPKSFAESYASKNQAFATAKIVSAHTQFAFKLYQKLLEETPDKNLFISPTSISLALAMAYNGAGGETQKAMAQALDLDDLSREEINQESFALQQHLKSIDPKIELDIANSLWANSNRKTGGMFSSDFIQESRAYYDAEVRALDFNQPESLGTINDWITEKTKGKINHVLSDIRRNIFLLIDAVYFKGKWTRTFDKSLTKEGPFTLLDGREEKRPRMSQSGAYAYYRGNDFQAVRLPYGDKKVSMLIFLPDKQNGLTEFERNLTAENWEKWMRGFGFEDGDIVIPRFKMGYGDTLNKALEQLGMGVVFSNGADFQRMFLPRVKIEKVIHKAILEVDEEGTTAAAVTVIGGARASMASPYETKHFAMIMDHPFFCAIRDDTTGEILFMGSVLDPKGE